MIRLYLTLTLTRETYPCPEPTCPSGGDAPVLRTPGSAHVSGRRVSVSL